MLLCLIPSQYSYYIICHVLSGRFLTISLLTRSLFKILIPWLFLLHLPQGLFLLFPPHDSSTPSSGTLNSMSLLSSYWLSVSFSPIRDNLGGEARSPSIIWVYVRGECPLDQHLLRAKTLSTSSLLLREDTKGHTCF